MKFFETADEVSAEVEGQKRDGYDAIKVYNLLPATAFEAAIRTAGKVGLPVYGHVPRSVGLSGALAALPRAGAWMAWIKKAAGVVLLLMAEYYFVKAGQVW